MENSGQTDDFDATIVNFNDIFLKYLILTLFGYLVPVSFLFYYFILLIELYIDRDQYLFLNRRPSPQELNSIGYFHLYLKICPILSMIFISYYLSFYALRLTLNINFIYLAFVVVLLGGSILFQLVYAINPKGTLRMNNLIVRQKEIGGPGLTRRAEVRPDQPLPQEHFGCAVFGREQ